MNHNKKHELLQVLMTEMEKKSGTPQEIAYDEIKDFFDSAPPLRDGNTVCKKLHEFLETNSSSTGNHINNYVNFVNNLIL